MADNIDITPGTGKTVRTTESGGVHTQHALLSSLVAGVPTPLAGMAGVPSPADVGIPVRPIGQDTISASFTGVGSSLLSPFMTQLSLRTMTVAQSAGNLVVTATTTANAEFLARSNTPVAGAWQAKYQSILSQRIANNNFAVILGDLIGVGLTATWTSTVLTITQTAHGFTAANVGQAMMVSLPTVTSGTALPGRYVIAGVTDANTFTVTVAGWTSGGGTVTLFGRTHVKVLYSGTSSTSAAYDTQREGWGSGDTTLTLNTSTSPGHMVLLNSDARQHTVSDMLVASGTAMASTLRGFRLVNLPADDTPLYLFLWAYNGGTNPASGTTWTVGFWSVEDFSATPVHIAGNRLQGTAAPLPTTQVGTVTITGSVTADTELPTAAALSDANSNPAMPTVGAIGLAWNPPASTYARLRTTHSLIGLDPSAKTVSTNGVGQVNYNHRGIAVQVNATAVTGTTPSLTFKVQESFDGGTTWSDMDGATSLALTTTGSITLKVYPGCTPVANKVVDLPVPSHVRVVYLPTGTTPSFTTNTSLSFLA